MTVIAALLAVSLPVTVWLLLRHHAQQIAALTVERRELLNRIQRPDLLPSAQTPLLEIPDQEPDELGLVGTVAEPSAEQLAELVAE